MHAHSEHSRLFQWLVGHALACYGLMTLSFVIFGALSLDLVKYVSANASFLLEYGGYALMEGGLHQLLELWAKVLIAIATYLIFKLCEHALIERLAHRPTKPEADTSH